MTTYIRTMADHYELNHVIDVTDNEQFVNTTSFDWINIGELTAKNGDIFYDNKIISYDSEDYKIIEDIVFEKVEAENVAKRELEEQQRLQQEKELADAMAAAEADAQEKGLTDRTEAELEITNKPAVLPEHLRPVPENFEEVLATLPIPNLIDYIVEFKDTPSTFELLKEWTAKNKEMLLFVAALETATIEGKKVIFAEPFTRNEGTPEEEILPFIYTPHPDLKHYQDHMKAQQANLELYLAKLRTDLGLA